MSFACQVNGGIGDGDIYAPMLRFYFFDDFGERFGICGVRDFQSVRCVSMLNIYKDWGCPACGKLIG